MSTAAETSDSLATVSEVRRVSRFDVRGIRSSEWLLLMYFVYVGIWATWNAGSVSEWAYRDGAIAAGAYLLFTLARLQERTGSLVISCVRDWLPTALILVAYWTVDWFQPPESATHFDNTWIGLDRILLQTWGLKGAVESLGPVLPSVLEFCYSVLYAVAPVSVGILYLCRRRQHVDAFLSTLLLGTLVTYALLPHFPSLSPRVAFPGQDLPSYDTPFRLLNLWLLSSYDIRTSVFPSGHVTLGFSAAFGMLVAMPERRSLGVTLFILATGVMVATVYGRYHYAVDGLAGLGISLLAGILTTLHKRRRQFS